LGILPSKKYHKAINGILTTAYNFRRSGHDSFCVALCKIPNNAAEPRVQRIGEEKTGTRKKIKSCEKNK
jgi:hypothetical protein